MDIVERLRLRIHTSEDETALTNLAADEIERLRVSLRLIHGIGLEKDAIIKQMREILQLWVNFWEDDGDDVWLAESAMMATEEILERDK